MKRAQSSVSEAPQLLASRQRSLDAAPAGPAGAHRMQPPPQGTPLDVVRLAHAAADRVLQRVSHFPSTHAWLPLLCSVIQSPVAHKSRCEDFIAKVVHAYIACMLRPLPMAVKFLDSSAPSFIWMFLQSGLKDRHKMYTFCVPQRPVTWH